MIAQKLPNGFCVLVLSPREAVHLADQILEPGEYPWQNTEAQMVALEAKARLKDLVENQAAKDLNRASKELQEAATGETATNDE